MGVLLGGRLGGLLAGLLGGLLGGLLECPLWGLLGGLWWDGMASCLSALYLVACRVMVIPHTSCNVER